MNTLRFIIFTLLLSTNCFGAYDVDLGEVGNDYGFKKFKKYQAKKHHCADPKDGLKKIMITGFGPFKKRGHNTSALTLEKFAKEEIKLKEESFGGEVRQKIMTIDDQEVQFCFVKLEVFWDLSSAIILNEAALFKPDLILMMGEGYEGQITIETTARNTSSKSSGYNFMGEKLEINTPQEFLLMNRKSGAHKFETMTWDATQIYEKTIGSMKRSPENLVLNLATKHRKRNIYICNAVSFTTLHSLQNKPLYLFKDKLLMKPSFEKEIQAGFLHLPKLTEFQVTEKMLTFLSDFLKKTIEVHL